MVSMDIVLQYVFIFFFYSFAGWVMESCLVSLESKKLIDRGFLIGPICPIYGYGVVLITLLLTRYQGDSFVLFCMSILICGTLEYLTSYIMEKIFKARWWDYTGRIGSINGRVCLVNSIMFGILSLFVINVSNPWLTIVIGKIPALWKLLTGVLLTFIYIIDFSISFKIVLNLKDISKEIKDNTEEISKKVRKIIESKSVFHRRLVNAFPNIKDKVNFKDWVSIDSFKNRIKKIKENNDD